ncbi:MAG: FCD domain-containing protein [Rhodobacteraceae bacterium]|nr:FCD domain-containing protein [Paracoccaceae bacterium]
MLRGEVAFDEHRAVVHAIIERDEDAAYKALRDHISNAFVARLKAEASKNDQS